MAYKWLSGLPLQLKGPLGLFEIRREFLPSPESLSHRGMTSAVGQNVNKKQNNTRFQHTGVNFRSERNSKELQLHHLVLELENLSRSKTKAKQNSTYRSQFQIRKDIVKIVELRELQLHHLVLELENAPGDSVENVPENSPLLGVDDLVVARLQATEDLDVLDVHRGQQLEGSQAILVRRKIKQNYLIEKYNDY